MHNVVPQSELMAKENAMTEMEEEISMMKMRLQNIEDSLGPKLVGITIHSGNLTWQWNIPHV